MSADTPEAAESCIARMHSEVVDYETGGEGGTHDDDNYRHCTCLRNHIYPIREE